MITAVNLARPIHESVLPEDLQEEFAKQSLYFGPTPTVREPSESSSTRKNHGLLCCSCDDLLPGQCARRA